MSKGFALVAALLIAVLLVMLCLAMISLSYSVDREILHDRHQQIANANARMALIIAVGEMQKYLGQDQRVTANAAILDKDPTTETIEGVEHPNLLGVWRNCTDDGFHLIGKDIGSSKSDQIYGAVDYYKDLRFSNSDYDQGKWKDNCRLTWLASFDGKRENAHLRVLSDEKRVTFVGEGTLGDKMRLENPERFKREQIHAERIRVGDGAFAWVVIDNSQKASIQISQQNIDNTEKLLEAAASDDIEGLDKLKTPLLGDYMGKYSALDHAEKHSEKASLSYKSLALQFTDPQKMAAYLGEDFNHFTHDSSGLFTDMVYGGFRKDLGPLVFGNPMEKSIKLERSDGNIFDSAYPLIPGMRHRSHGPSFDALRSWGRQKYASGIQQKSMSADTGIAKPAMRKRPTAFWKNHENDGHTFNASDWAADAPKLFPLMTDVRFHYYFGLTNTSPRNRIRTHLLPRVCLWNPYSVELEVPELIVLIPNFFSGKGTFHFVVEGGEVVRFKSLYPDDPSVQNWDGKFRMWSKGLFPRSRFLAFLLEPTTIAAGDCLVFSPKVVSGEASAVVKIAKYQVDDVKNNVLSAEAPQGKDHFYHDTLELSEPPLNTHSRFDELKLEAISSYEPWVVDYENFNFALKSSLMGSFGGRQTAQQVTESPKNYTLQLLNGSNGGANTYNFWYYSPWIGNSRNASGGTFGNLQAFTENPYKNPPATHQIGVKMLWFDESAAEANAPPLRVGKWSPEHSVYHPSTILNWNVRAQLITRSPASLCTSDWYTNSLGAWMTQLSPLSPRDPLDMPSLNRKGQFAKFPFGAALDFPGMHSAVMFDLPHSDYGALSLAKLRHAQLSPYSWHPSYIIGSSHKDLHAPYGASAHEVGVRSNSRGTQWDYLIGGTLPKSNDWGPRSGSANSEGLLQIGSYAENPFREEEILAYDIVFETNLNLWDSFFFSGISLHPGGKKVVQNPLAKSSLLNQRYEYNSDLIGQKSELELLLESNQALGYLFWNSGCWLRNTSAFNINSTSVPAWTAFISGIRDVRRPLRDNTSAGGSGVSVFSRVAKPQMAVEMSDPSDSNEWNAARKLSDEDIAKLAIAIVSEVKTRGPFISLADMINRRLVPLNTETFNPDPSSLEGTIDAAIRYAGLNSPAYHSGIWKTRSDRALNNNKSEFKNDHADMLETSKARGAPGFITQADLIEPLAPAISARGDTFTIRCYGESRDAGSIKAVAYLEATVKRMPDYVESRSIESKKTSGNLPIEPAMLLDYSDGSVAAGKLTDINKAYGRKFEIMSVRWLSPSEI